jgi:hypothetical protein
MAKAKVPKTKIQAYFTHPDRPVNFGRITNIEKDQYGRGIPAASSQEVDAFVEQWNETRGSRVEAVAGAALGALSSPLAPEAIGALFEAKRQAWFVRDGETEILECKKSFHLSGRVFRAVAALANNRGGYVIFGVKDEGYEVVGLDNDKFATLDKNIFSQAISAAMEPLPRFEITHTQINKMMVGVMFVHPEPDRPVIATKNDQDFKEGTIYYRYPGESRAIRAAEFRRILADRDRQARLEANQSLRKILELGRNAAVLDLESGRIDGVANSIMIDEGLLSKIQFVREGEFVEKKGTPALRLVGEVRAIGQLAPSHGPLKIVREAVDEADVLPIFYYAKMSRLPLKEIRSLLLSVKRLMSQASGTFLNELTVRAPRAPF